MSIRLASSWRSAAVLAFAAALLFAGTGTASAQVKVGIVDLNRAMEQSIGGKAALASLKKMGEQFRQQMIAKTESLRKMEDSLLKMRQDLRQKGLLFSEDVRREKEEELLRKQRAFQRARDDLVRFRQEAESDFGRERRRVTRKVQLELRDVINRIAKKEKYTIILERSVVLFFDGERIDLTDQVIRAYDKAKR
ncbi:MAG: OmpH family outer membrane protein [Nitrospinota bacterium]